MRQNKRIRGFITNFTRAAYYIVNGENTVSNPFKEETNMCNGMCGGNFGDNWWWVIILLILFGGNSCGCENNSCGCGGNNWWWIIILALLGVWNNGSEGCGCGSTPCGC